MVPEIASRAHVEMLNPVIAEAIVQAGIADDEIDAVAATYGPGLVGSLLVGVSAAKALALVWDVPFVAVNHLEAHLYASFLEERLRLDLTYYNKRSRDALVAARKHTDSFSLLEVRLDQLDRDDERPVAREGPVDLEHQRELPERPDPDREAQRQRQQLGRDDPGQRQLDLALRLLLRELITAGGPAGRPAMVRSQLAHVPSHPPRGQAPRAGARFLMRGRQLVVALVTPPRSGFV